jgi:hypothetical protein
MASTNDVIFSESLADIIANPVDICFGSIPATSSAEDHVWFEDRWMVASLCDE